jgi:hypothetical protein
VLTPFSSSASSLPPRVGQSFARNNFFAIPFLLGLVGLVMQLRRRGTDALIVGLLFLFTGLAIVVYLNQPPLEPRERDYTFCGATFAFAIWIGLGVIGLAQALRAVVQAEGLRLRVAVLLGLVAPTVLVAQGWDDHDRSGRYSSVDAAKNLLNSCAPNAILITNGDNDTFPLWYAQEVEGVRTDVRVAVLPYMNTDWYIQQLKRPAYQSAPLPLSMDNVAYAQGNNDMLPFMPNPAVDSLDVKQFIGLVGQGSPLLRYTEGAYSTSTFPTPHFFLNVDTATVKQAGILPTDRRRQLVSELHWSMGKRAIEKKHLMILDLIATNNWKRPIYFSSTVATPDFLNLQPYFQLEGMAYRLLPLKDPSYTKNEEEGFVETSLNYQQLMHTFAYRGLNKKGTYYDENSLRFPAYYRDKFSRLANAYLAKGNAAKAREVADYCLQVMPPDTVPYDSFSPLLAPALAAGGERQRANVLLDTTLREATQSLNYYAARPDAPLFDYTRNLNLLQVQNVYRAAAQLQDEARAQQAMAVLQPYLQAQQR